MKVFWLKASLLGILLALVAIVGTLPTRSDSGQAQTSSSDNDKPKIKKQAAHSAAAALSYRSPGAQHKLVIPNKDTELQQVLQNAHAIGKARKLKDYSIVEVSSDTLHQLTPEALERLQVRDDLNLLLLKRGQIDTTGPAPVIAEDLQQSAKTAYALHLVQLFGPPTPDALATIKGTGARIVAYVPNNAYLVWGSASQISRLTALREKGNVIQWDGPYHPAYKLDSQLQLDSSASINATITVFDTADAQKTMAHIKSLARGVLMSEFKLNGKVHIKVATDTSHLKELAQMPDVLSIERMPKFRMFDERQDQILAGALTQDTINNVSVSRPTGPGYLAFLASIGINSRFDFAVDVADTGFDLGTADATRVHPDFLDANGHTRIAYLFDYTNDSHPSQPDVQPFHDPVGHGTLSASIIGSFSTKEGALNKDELNYQLGLGMAPFAQVGVSKIFTDSEDFSAPAYPDLIGNAYRSGARISSNSWGGIAGHDYAEDSQVYDGLVRDAIPGDSDNESMTVVFAAGNQGDEVGPDSIGVPGTAKNVITVGATENFRANGADGNPAKDACGWPGTVAENASNILDFSSFGPLEDGRMKPDIVAPGSRILGAATQDPTSTGICDLGRATSFTPPGQQLYTWASGTSFSAPAVAGGAALVYQWYRTAQSVPPSPAMVKALLLNSASYLDGQFGKDNLPGVRQGWGLMNLGRLFDPQTSRILYDESPARTFTESGGTPFEITGVITDPTKEFRVMLAYTDAPGDSATNAAYVNQVNLEVVVGGVVYEANNFNGAYSQPGGQLDILNNTQGVRLPAGTTGPFVIRVKPTIIAGDGVPNVGGSLDQDFALVVTNGTEAAVPVITVDNTTGLTAGVSVHHPNNTDDSSLIPGEQDAITVTVSNQSATASADITGLALTLNVGSQGVSAGTSGGTLATLAPGQSLTNSTPFTLQVPSALQCGSTAQLQLTVETSSGTFTLPVLIQAGRTSGEITTVFNDNVDSASVKWKMKKGFEIVNTAAHSGTMSFHVEDPNDPNDDSRQAMLFTKKAFNIPRTAGQVRLSFFHIFNFEPGFDGGILEISTDNGLTWADLGSRILVGGYDGMLGSLSLNPLGGRFAWTARGKSGVFSPVVVALDDFAGQHVKFRFQAGFDAATGVDSGYQGWFIDDIKLTFTDFSCGATTTQEQPAEKQLPQDDRRSERLLLPSSPPSRSQ